MVRGRIKLKNHLTCPSGAKSPELLKQGMAPTAIAQALGRHRSTIYRELQRNRCRYDGAYRPFKASRRTRGRRRRSRRNLRIDVNHWSLVTQLLRGDWSPEQIAGRLKRSNTLRISHETIYKRIWADKKAGGNLYTHLRGASKKRRKRYGAYDSRGRLAGKKHISERPAEVEDRRTFGHWEIDTVMGTGSKHCILTMVERTTGFTLIGQLADRTVERMNERAIALIRKHRKRFRTLTADNGTEFHGYKHIEAATRVPVYFCTPHHSWERGTNENTNGLIRQYLPKGTSMAAISQRQCQDIADILNARPRKRLAFQSPAERLREIA